jgi:hypothetical protein
MRAWLAGLVGNPWLLLALFLAGLTMGTGAGWVVNGWRLGHDLAELQAARADERANQAQAALQDLAEATKKINDAAAGAQADVSALDDKLEAIRKDVKNAMRKPLPVDCKPTADRVLSLGAAASAVDQAIAGTKPGGAVQAERRPGS